MSTIKIASEFDTSADLIIFNGDIRELLPKIPDNFVSLVVTSPPYNIGKEYETKMNLEAYKDFQREVIKECVRVLKPEGSICWQVGNYVNNSSIVPLDIILYSLSDF